MTTINHDDMDPVRAIGPRRRPAGESVGAGSRTYWLWASASSAAAVAGTAAVDVGQTVSVAIGALAVAAIGGAMDHSGPPPVSDVPSRTAVPELAAVYRRDEMDAAG